MKTKSIQKREQIKKLLEKGWTTRGIAKKVKVSLRDVVKVRQELGLHFGVVERKKQTIKEQTASLDSMYAKHEQELKQNIAPLLQQIKAVTEELRNLELERQRKREEPLFGERPVVPIYVPENLNNNNILIAIESMTYEERDALLTELSKIQLRHAKKDYQIASEENPHLDEKGLKALARLCSAYVRTLADLGQVRVVGGQPVKPISTPTNFNEVTQYLESLNNEQLLTISKMASDMHHNRALSDYYEELIRLEEAKLKRDASL